MGFFPIENNMVESKKYLLIVVEGPSDRTSLENALRKMLTDIGSTRNLEIDVVHGDLLVVDKNKKLITYNKEEENVTSQIEAKIKKLHLKPSDIIAISMITDLDACFAPNSFFSENPSYEKVFYNLEKNICERKDINNLIDMRKKKLSVIRRMHNKSHINIGGHLIKYRLFYLNVDLEWVFHSKLNQTNLEKTTLSEKFDDKYGNNTDEFLSFINSLPKKSDSFLESWNAVFNGEIEPLEKATNINQLIEWISKC